MFATKKMMACFMAVTLLLSACSANKNGEAGAGGSTASGGKEKVEITFAESIPSKERTAVLKQLIDDFQAKNPDIKVNFESNPVEQAREKLIAMATAKNLPDVFEVSNSWIGPLAVNNALEDLEPYVDKFANRTDFTDSAMALGKSYGDKLYWIPYGTYGIAVYYNKKMFADAGLQPPATTEDFYNAAKALTNPANNQYGYSFRGGVYGFTHALLWMMGATGVNSLFDENGKSLLDSPQAVEALSKYASLYIDKLVPADSLNWSYKETVEAFTTGVTAMLIQSNEVVAISKEKMGDNFGTAMLPLGPSGKQFDTSGQNGYAIASTSKHKEAAAKLLEYLMSAEPNLKFTKFSGFTPVLKSIQDDPAFSDGPIKVYKDQMNSSDIEYANLPTYLPEWSEFITQFSTSEVQKLILKQQTAEQTAKNLADFLNEAMDKWNKK
ncbi:ABC transporter substrate-binding protein [Cohnella boryungensis]|uniref:ABC transporter substrate-binding protein n=1 Tax=Cohnella boryungensis TaxID=768479 RepID=A0ABV8SFT2_9BACL